MRFFARRSNDAFTIVELMVVVIVIGILATISVVGYGQWRTGVNTSTVKNDLMAAASAMEGARSDANGYPSTIPSSFSPSQNVVITLASSSSKAFCLDGTYSTNSSIKYYADEKTRAGQPTAGSCASRVVASQPGPVSGVTNYNTSATQILVQWSLASPNYATSYSVQCAQDTAYTSNLLSTTVNTASATSASFSGAQSGVTYYCRVRAVNANGQSDWVSASQTAATCNESNKYGTYPNCYAYDSLALGTSISGYWTSPPEGYLFENGSAVSRTTYSDLFALIGTTYGAGDGSTTFNLPDSRGRVTVNINASDAEFNTVGQRYGEKNHQLTVNEMPTHSHAQNVSANTGGDGIRRNYSSDGNSYPYSMNAYTGSTGGNAPYSVIQPTIVKNYAIKYRPSTGVFSTLPAGITLQGYWSTVPQGYLYEDGSAVSRSTYSALYSATGTTYGAGDGSTTFNLPDSRGRVGVGLMTGDAQFGSRGQLTGEKRHTLTIAEMVPHNHMFYVTANTGGGGIRRDYGDDGPGLPYDQGVQTDAAGGGQPHNIIQPSMTKRSTVKTSAPTGSQADLGIAPGTSVEGWWSSAPSGYLLENGAAVSRTTYSALFAVIGTTYGAGDGSTTFNLPDSRGRVAANLSPFDSEFNALGKQFGSKTHIMTLAELPSHSHNENTTANDGCCGIRRTYKSDGDAQSYSMNLPTGTTGGGAAFNIIQPSITKIMAIKF